MKRLFQKWLLVFVAGAFVLTFVGSWWIHSSLAQESARELLRVKLDDAARQVKQTQENLDTVIQMSNASSLSKARSFAYMIEANPAILKDRAELERIRRLLDVDELHVSDTEGILIASIPQKYEGYHMAAEEQSAAFMKALTDPAFELAQKPRLNGIVKEYFQYAGVARRGIPGIVQIGYCARRIREAAEIADIRHITSTFRIGSHGGLKIVRTDAPDAPLPGFFRKNIAGEPAFCLAERCGNYLLIGYLPEDEMYLSRNSVLRILVIANLILFGVIFLLVSGLLQQVVIKGIYSVNDSLQEITAGNLNEKIAVKTTTEFAALSDGINATVEALKKSIDSEARRIDAELEMGRTIQNSVLPTDFPEDRRFALAAGMYAAKEVGGDFYDFFMVDETHLAVLIADVSGKGITAALFMMNAKALLKELIASGLPPGEAVARANRDLCANNRARMFLTLFLAVFDTERGELTCVNGGHNPPVLVNPGEAPHYLKIRHSVPLGFTPKAVYTEVPVPLARGARLLLYTDGVTEALGPDGTFYGETRLLQSPALRQPAPADAVRTLRAEVAAFSDTVPQSDDVTLLILDRPLPAP